MSETHVDTKVASKMELNIKKTSSKALLSCGNGQGLNTCISSYNVGKKNAVNVNEKSLCLA